MFITEESYTDYCEALCNAVKPFEMRSSGMRMDFQGKSPLGEEIYFDLEVYPDEEAPQAVRDAVRREVYSYNPYAHANKVIREKKAWDRKEEFEEDSFAIGNMLHRLLEAVEAVEKEFPEPERE